MQLGFVPHWGFKHIAYALTSSCFTVSVIMVSPWPGPSEDRVQLRNLVGYVASRHSCSRMLDAHKVTLRRSREASSVLHYCRIESPIVSEGGETEDSFTWWKASRSTTWYFSLNFRVLSLTMIASPFPTIRRGIRFQGEPWPIKGYRASLAMQASWRRFDIVSTQNVQLGQKKIWDCVLATCYANEEGWKVLGWGIFIQKCRDRCTTHAIIPRSSVNAR
jgi:hypothetical protein